MSDSSSFFLLDERIQRFIWAEGWSSLRDAQELAIPLIVEGGRDVIVAAATAAGKTEAAFLPALTYLLAHADERDLIVYISPLKALINDQFGRLDRLCENLDIPVWPWHGDISSSQKQRFIKGPKGVLLITPESVEAMLCNRGTSVAGLFSRAAFFVVDELHAFIGSERGKQLQSLMHRIERVVGRPIARVGLSATLGDMQLAAEFLRPGHAKDVAIVESKSAHAELKVLVKGYEEPLVVRVHDEKTGEDSEEEPEEDITPGQIAAHLFKVLRGTNNLIFPNSRRAVETYTHILNKLCEQAQVPNEFWPHHGSLSKEIRTETEAALKRKDQPASAICTNTLELGIDIGAVKSVAQIGSPPSVASLRQRLGRSGRREGEPAILRGFVIQQALDVRSGLSERLRLGTVELAAMISLLVEKWFEPPAAKGVHLSTLVQQLLSAIAQYGGLKAGQAFSLLCASDAPFAGLGADEFKELLRHLGQQKLLVQDSSGLLLHGEVGEKFVNHYTFYAAFTTEEEYRLVASGRTLGSLPVTQLLRIGQNIVFAGRTWCVEEVDDEHKTIYVRRTKGGRPPAFSGAVGGKHTRVRQRMRELLGADRPVPYVDQMAQQFLQEGRRAYKDLGLATQTVVDGGAQQKVFTWLGNAGSQALVAMLHTAGLRADIEGPIVEVYDASQERVVAALRRLAAADRPTVPELLEGAKNLQLEKWDWALPTALLQKGYASMHLDIDEARNWLTENFGTADAEKMDTRETP